CSLLSRMERGGRMAGWSILEVPSRPGGTPEQEEETLSLLDGRPALSPEELAAQGRFIEAIRYGTEQNLRARDPFLEEWLVQWRYDAFASIDNTPRSDWPPAIKDPFPALNSIPEIRPNELTAELLGGSILHHGCLIVRGLISTEKASRLIADFDRSFEACKAAREGAPIEQTRPWYAPFSKCSDLDREFVYPGGIFAADSPRMMFDLVELFSMHGIKKVISE